MCRSCARATAPSRRGSSASASPYRENLVPATPLWQLFVYDPNGVQLELTFHSAAEREDVPVIPPQRRYAARERWFQPAPYRQFAAPR